MRSNLQGSVAYDEVVKQAVYSHRGDYDDLSYNPVFRASALFHVLTRPHLTTRISFLNYWWLKNDNHSVSALLTLRNPDGQKVARHFFAVEGYVYDLNVADLLGHPDPFTGTLEVELYS